jgi:hypothetical protein
VMIKIALLFFSVLYAETQVMKGEYIVSAKKELFLEKIKTLPPDSMKNIGPNQYLLIYKNDPGLEGLSEHLKGLAVQPNFIYTAKKKGIKFKKGN